VVALQGLPSVRHEVLPPIATHFLVTAVSHLPLQHSPSAVQLSATGVSALQRVVEQVPPTHESEQQSVLFVHAALGPPHPPPLMAVAQSPVAAPVALLQFLEQQSVARPQP
jgi:hypothetical protein